MRIHTSVCIYMSTSENQKSTIPVWENGNYELTFQPFKPSFIPFKPSFIPFKPSFMDFEQRDVYSCRNFATYSEMSITKWIPYIMFNFAPMVIVRKHWFSMLSNRNCENIKNQMILNKVAPHLRKKHSTYRTTLVFINILRFGNV
jgi:hypothetical protein